jgi:uncharacterized protein YndB with AHSA1/START domain
MDNGRGAVRTEDVYDTDIADLWSALTDPVRLARWVATVDGDLRLGGTVQTRFTSGWEGPGRVTICQAPHHLALTMNPGTPDETELEAILTSEQEKTRLVIEERGIPFDVIVAHGAGWQAHVEDLATSLSGQRAGDWVACMRTSGRQCPSLYARSGAASSLSSPAGPIAYGAAIRRGAEPVRTHPATCREPGAPLTDDASRAGASLTCG